MVFNEPDGRIRTRVFARAEREAPRGEVEQ